MNLRRWLTGWVWAWAAWRAARRRPRVRAGDAAQLDFPTQTRRMGLSMTEFLRNRLRGRWLRFRRR